MDPRHPLDHAIWNALTTRQAPLSLGSPLALRLAPQFGIFAATPDHSPASLAALAALLPEGGRLMFMEPDPPPPPPGTTVLERAPCYQMVGPDCPTGGATDFAVEPLGEADAPAMLALATLTAPGPFFARTHELGRFVGVKHEGRLVAMAGERLQPEGFTEVSGVCTHPDHRGRGYAGGLMRIVTDRILARGEGAMLHVDARNAGAVALYESLGFVRRMGVTRMVLARS